MPLAFGLPRELADFEIGYDPDTDTIDLWCRPCRAPVREFEGNPQLLALAVQARAHRCGQAQEEG